MPSIELPKADEAPVYGDPNDPSDDHFNPFDTTRSINTTGITFDESFMPPSNASLLFPSTVPPNSPPPHRVLAPALPPTAYFTAESRIIRTPVNVRRKYSRRPQPGTYPPEDLIHGLPLIGKDYLLPVEEVLSEPEKDGLAVPRVPASSPEVEEQLLRMLGGREVDEGEVSLATRRADDVWTRLENPAEYGVMLDPNLVAMARRRRKALQKKK